ncbi:hypothetical protein [Tellurirhabdus rosea]|uniref:hypothetical protein n=1 Tax=Tellurirhabdus rosea TaxID=2674997 RepID=UPI0022541156|nr:hypothetical protein [Tellurirhabdus rosea]
MPRTCHTRWACNLSAWLILLMLVLGISFLATAQKKPVTKAKKMATTKTPFQGLCGTVLFKSGNNMPTVDRPQPKGQPVAREVLIYELTGMNQVKANDEGFYTEVASKLIKTVKSGKDGRFCVSLPAGSYSVFVKEEKGLYANEFDGENHIFPVKIEKGRKSTAKVEISYAAVF